jgi:hypothetical protein
MQIHANTCKYMQIHANTCNYVHVTHLQNDIVKWCIMLDDEEEKVPEQVCVLRKLRGPLEKLKVPIIPVDLIRLSGLVSLASKHRIRPTA